MSACLGGKVQEKENLVLPGDRGEKPIHVLKSGKEEKLFGNQNEVEERGPGASENRTSPERKKNTGSNIGEKRT